MAVLDVEDRVAILLNVLGGDAVEASLTRLPPGQAAEVRKRVLRVQEQPPSPEEIDEVLDEFERSLQLTAPSTKSLLHVFQATDDEVSEGDEADRAADGGANGDDPGATGGPRQPRPAAARRTAQAPFEPSDDPLADLARLSAARVAGALQDETPRTAALVLSCLPADRAAEIIRLMPEPIRSQSFLQLSQVVAPPQPLLLRAVRTTVARAAALEETPDEQAGGDEKMVEMLRAMNRKTRSQLLELLDQEQPEMAERLRTQLFVFADLLRIESRSLQKLLMESETQGLLTALRNADERIVEKIMANVSRRTREALQEEMQYQAPVPDEAIEAARLDLVRQMAQLDQLGQLVLED